MNELLIERLKKSIGWNCRIFLHNGFRYQGKILNVDEKYLEILESRGYKIILLSDINNCEIDKIQGELK